ncbi:MAG: hypothetical protein WBB01_19320 [Phormidesmis sp.]
MVQTLVKPLTLETFLKLPETKPASEFLDISSGLYSKISTGTSNLPSACQILPAVLKRLWPAQKGLGSTI